ncbi:SDR family NAD(P)-dependent oxidoreductase [Aliifodinibius salicampi]|uniref:SDR family NAD(P)-dependent oxidoreductase n=1 Tax=Fodinibius salicampi TaxID=1920655 RepID=A0ABT3Q1A7_9BACT|nr:SDR family NAD(P)-dependent oxidoreductase [Fodinibius salicampi]MCW9713892.1 SDR family NAD(P)-dependent oxidoreductase [Fodinibius salicampi]
MTLQNNTVLITGGSSGIGFELAKQLTKQDNRVLICGRSIDKLEKAKRLLPDIHYLQCDISRADECNKLASWIHNEHPDCNILINNAAIVHTDHFFEDDYILEKANTEVQTKLMGPIRLSKLFIPILQKNKRARIINITTGLVYVPRATYPFYNATKAALHSFTQVLRSQLNSSPIDVIEVLFPAVDTPWHKGNPPAIAISTEEAVQGMLTGLKKGKEEIRVGKVKLLYLLSRIAPNFAFKKLNSLANR